MADLFQDSFIEKLLQLLIAVVNAELLKAVHLKIFYNIMTNNYIKASCNNALDSSRKILLINMNLNRCTATITKQ